MLSWVAAALLLVGSASAAWPLSCTITSTTADYGTVDILSGNAADTSANFSISCSGWSYEVVRLCIEQSKGQTDSSGHRRLAAGSGRLVHELYSDAARTNIWGSWGASSTAYALYPYGITYDLNLGGGGSASHTFTMYGRVFASQQTSPPGSYVWTTSTSPTIQYGDRGGAACPTGSLQAGSGGSTWSATINSDCNVSATNINFGSVGFLSANVDATGAISVQCTSGTPFNIGLNAGAGSGATVAARKMTSGARTVTYSLYTDSGRASAWGNTVGTNTVAGTGTGLAGAITVYGRVPAQTTPAPGTYSDTIIVTVTY